MTSPKPDRVAVGGLGAVGHVRWHRRRQKSCWPSLDQTQLAFCTAPSGTATRMPTTARPPRPPLVRPRRPETMMPEAAEHDADAERGEADRAGEVARALRDEQDREAEQAERDDHTDGADAGTRGARTRRAWPGAAAAAAARRGGAGGGAGAYEAGPARVGGGRCGRCAGGGVGVRRVPRAVTRGRDGYGRPRGRRRRLGAVRRVRGRGPYGGSRLSTDCWLRRRCTISARCRRRTSSQRSALDPAGRSPEEEPVVAAAEADDDERQGTEQGDVEAAEDHLLEVDATVAALGQQGPGDAVRDEPEPAEQQRWRRRCRAPAAGRCRTGRRRRR